MPFGISAETITDSNIAESYQLDATISKEHSLNSILGLEKYNDAFINLMIRDPCKIISKESQKNRIPISVNECVNFAEETAVQGLSVIITRYFENIRLMNAAYYKFVEDEIEN